MKIRMKLNVGNFSILMFFIVFSIALYFNALDNGFTFDDETVIVRNDAIKSIRNIPRLLTSPFVPFADDTRAAIYRPLTAIILTLLYAIDGLNPALFHLFNIIIHGINSFIGFLLIYKIFNKRKIAFIASLIFLIHPAQTDVVAAAVNISAIMMAFFSLLSLFLYLQAPDKKYIYLSVFSYFLSLFFREDGAFMIVFIILYDFFENYRLDLRRIFKEKFLYYIWYVLAFFTFLLLRTLITKTFFTQDYG